MRTTKIWSFVGAGGKTTGIFCLADYMLKQGLRVLVTTTTHMARPENPAFLPGDLGVEIVKRLEQDGFVIGGVPVSDKKIKGISRETLMQVKEAADLILIEADGSARLPFKVPAMHEPVIVPETDRIFVTMGLTALGRPVVEICHRKEIFCEMTGKEQNSLLDEAGMAEGIYRGYLLRLWKEHPEAAITVILNQADDHIAEAAGSRVKHRLLELFGQNKDELSVNWDVKILSWKRLMEEGEDLGWLFT